MTFDIQMSTNVVMPHPNDALLRHDDYLIVTSYEYCAGTWRHRQVGGPPEKSSSLSEPMLTSHHKCAMIFI